MQDFHFNNSLRLCPILQPRDSNVTQLMCQLRVITEGVLQSQDAVRKNTTEVTLPPPDSTTFCKIGIPSQMVLKWMFAFELAQKCKTSILTIAYGYANLYKKQQRHPKRCLCVLSCRDSNPERQNQNLLCYHYTTAQTFARKRCKGK